MNELKRDIEMLARLTFELSKKHDMRISTACVNTDGEYANSWVIFGKELNSCTYWADAEEFEYKQEVSDAHIQTKAET